MRNLRARCEELFRDVMKLSASMELYSSELSEIGKIEAFARSLIEECARVAEEGMITMRPEDFDREYIVAINGARTAIAAAIRQVTDQPPKATISE